MPYTTVQPLNINNEVNIGLQIDSSTMNIAEDSGVLSARQGVAQGDGGAVAVVSNKVSLNADGKTIVQDGNKNYKINIQPQGVL